MPVTPIFDLDSIDLDAVAIPADDIGRMNPQTGDMRQLDHVIHLDLDAGVIVGMKQVRDDEFWVPLHIPGRPLMPGVLMVEAAAQLSSVYYRFRVQPDHRRFLGFTRIDDTSFRGSVVPGDVLHMIVREVKVSPRQFVCDAQGFVGDKIVYETRITGMVM